MITSGEWLNPTRVVGLVAYGAAAACCGLAWIRLRKQRRRARLAAVLTMIECALLLDMAFNWRWALHGLIGNLAQRHHDYEFRRLPQLIALGALGALLVVGVIFAFRVYCRSIGSVLAVSGILLSLVVWCVEVISLHAVDHVLYHTVGRLMVVSLLWMAFSGLVSSGMIVDSRHG